jgi:hypothetical protein
MVDKLYAAARTVKSLDLEGMERKLKSLNNAIKAVESKISEGSKVFSKEERD